jgi:hypothetical protein
MKTIAEDTLETLRGEDVACFSMRYDRGDIFVNLFYNLHTTSGRLSYTDMVFVEGKAECKKLLVGFLLDFALRKKYFSEEYYSGIRTYSGKDKYTSLGIALNAFRK